MADPIARYTLMPWSRTGIASTLTAPDSATAPAVAQIPIEMSVDGETVSVTIRVYGPGDIRVIDPGLVIRTDPVAGATDFEDNCFAAVEFRRADLPWLFTPVASAGDHLRPWICLVVLPASVATVKNDPAYPNPTIDLQNAGQELPDPADLWATAHVQCAWVPETGPAAKSVSDQLTALLATDDPKLMSRLLCFRRLDPLTAYVACVVPSFELGRRAGLGEDPSSDDEKRLDPAWSKQSTTLKLPVFYWWQFSTGPGGDFASLALKLERVSPPLPDTVGLRMLDCSDPGYGAPSAGVLGMAGAVYPAKSPPAPMPASTVPFQAKIRDLINLGTAATPPLVGPPMYGAWYASQTKLPPPGANPLWLTGLNYDPRHRVAASIGAAVVNRHQEALMASAWDQLAHLKRANQILRQAQLARSISRATVDGHLLKLSPGSLPQISRPLHGRVLIDGQTVAGHVAQSGVARGAFSPALRRIASPQSPLGARLFADGKVMPLASRLVSGAIAVAPPRTIPQGSVTFDSVTSSAGTKFAGVTLAQSKPEQVDRAQGWLRTAHLAIAHLAARDGGSDVGWKGDKEGGIPSPPGFNGLSALDFAWMTNAFRAAARRHQAYLQQVEALPQAPDSQTPQPINEGKLISAIDPSVTVLASVQARLEAPAQVWTRTDPLDPMKEAPQFPVPMLEPLEEISQQWVLAGLENVPHDAVYVMESNGAFIAAHMLGLNHWMGRVLQWNEFPFFQRATFFRNFWPVAGTAADIDEIANWGPGDPLGGNSSAALNPLIVVIRSPIFQRYPDTAVYARHAVWNPDQRTRTATGERKDPLFRARLDPDITFFAFDLTLDQAKGGPPADTTPDTPPPPRPGPHPSPLPHPGLRPGQIRLPGGGITIDGGGGDTPPPPPEPGWFFVIEQHVHQPRFGLNAASNTNSDPPTWADVSWSNLVAHDDALKTLAYASMTWPRGATLTRALPNTVPTSASWGPNSDSGSIAAIALRDPIRVVLHASALLGGS